MLHVFDHERLEVPQPPDALQSVPIDGPAARDVEVLQAVVELPRDPVHAPLVNVGTVGEVQPLQTQVSQNKEGVIRLHVTLLHSSHLLSNNLSHREFEKSGLPTLSRLTIFFI